MTNVYQAERLALNLRFGSRNRSQIEKAQGILEKLDETLTEMKEAGANATVWDAAFAMPHLSPSQRRREMKRYARHQRAYSDLKSALLEATRTPNVQ